MNFIDFFAGIGGFRLGMEQAGHKCIGFCEYDKFAVASYKSMHLLTDKQIEYIKNISTPPKKDGKRNLNARQKEIQKEKYINGEWYASDIRAINAIEIPRADCWCFGFPCQDISIAGQQNGFKGNRSSLFFAVTKLIRELEEKDRPSYLFVENVKNLLSVNGGFDFAKLLIELDEIGYDAEWDVINSAEVVPQNRERIFVIGHLRGRSTRRVFPITNGNRQAIELQGQQTNTLTTKISHTGGTYIVESEQHDKKINTVINNKNQRKRVYGTDGLSQRLILVKAAGIYLRWQFLFLRPTDMEYMTKKNIRQLTPLEYFRLQGYPDDYFYKAQLVNSDSQLYKQAGNGVTVSVIYEIAKKMEVTNE